MVPLLSPYYLFQAGISQSQVVDSLKIAIESKIKAYYNWAVKVRGGGIWDHKAEIMKKNEEEFGKPSWSKYINSLGQEKQYEYETWSNIHYGYIGKLVGFSDAELTGGAGLAQMITNFANAGIPRNSIEQAMNLPKLINGSNPNASIFDLPSIDDPSDRRSVEFGIDLFDRFNLYMYKDDFMSQVFSSDLNTFYSYPVVIAGLP